MALKDSWEQQKQQRQQAAIERRQKVHEALTVTQQERQEKASQLRSDLSLFRETLASDDRSRNLEFQHFYAELKTETQAFLLNIRNQRQAQAQKTAQQLNEFVQNLQQQTASFLAMTEAERLLMARQLADDLQSFQSTLEANVSSLRQDIQLELQDLQIETQLLLDQYRQQHIKTQIRSARNLIAFTANLRSSIQEYLLEVSETRQKETELLAQRLQKSRRDRSAKVQALFGQLAEFRLQIQQYHANLKTIVWGEEMALCPVISETQKSATIAPQSTPHLLLQ
ncbi:MAG: hypothetical protein HC936_13305, partial [Leptolyngbyaceae cyanobacterium SU_3_3]|nr:hypothetical protein [Leptolyngbyaceae cyanobacterium SU_3_3]